LQNRKASSSDRIVLARSRIIGLDLILMNGEEKLLAEKTRDKNKSQQAPSKEDKTVEPEWLAKRRRQRRD
jgi:hypothetical protein